MSSGQKSGGINSWLATLMFGLLYPAVLGTFFYSLLPEALKLVREPWELNALLLAKFSISLLLVLHFILDFYFTQQVSLETDTYSGKTFLLDLLVILALFVAYDSVNLGDKDADPEVPLAAGALCFSYVLFQVWERWMEPAIARNLGLNIYEICAAIVFFVITVFFPTVELLAAAILAATLCMFFIARPIVLRVRREVRAANGKPEYLERKSG